MTRRKLTLASPIAPSYRVARVLGALDKPDLNEIVTELEFDEPPASSEDWSIGLIVGASGAGKTTIARSLYPTAFYQNFPWNERAVVDNFDPRPFDELAAALTAVGFASQVHWLRPFATLSAGERFRCDLAKALLDADGPIVVFDEYASLVDREVAKTTSIALRKAFDRGAFARKLVATTPHDDVQAWLEPDWTLDAATGELKRGRLRRPGIDVELVRVTKSAWNKFKKFHYLNGEINFAAKCYGAVISGPIVERPKLAAFAAILQAEGRVGRKRVHRLVVRPEFQGLGLGGAMLDALGELYRAQGETLEIVTGASGLIRRLERSKRWRFVRAYPHGRTQRHKGVKERGSFGRAIASFVFQ